MLDTPTSLLGGRTPAAFMRRFWQRHSLVVRGAMPGFEGFLSRDAMLALARRDDVESRLVVRESRRWSLVHGPLSKADIAALPPARWTLLVQGVNLHDDRGDALLRRFAFVPFARLDDLMVSYAAPGGGVGPHLDSYDVFLLQGLGRRRWRFGKQSDATLVPRAPLAILAKFKPTQEVVLGPGDLLYLPPNIAHDGVALEACTTYSIGFRAASAEAFATAFLDHLRDHLAFEGRYSDPNLRPSNEPARIDARMCRQLGQMLKQVRWDRALVARFAGCWLSEPTPIVTFERPAQALPAVAFRRRAARTGIKLDRRTQLLYDDDALYVNGEVHPWPRAGRAELASLANDRLMSAQSCAGLPRAAFELVEAWYRHGYLRFRA